MSYKVKRKTALSRLDAAEQNLLRVRDVLREVERQRNSLHRQAKKAERHQRMVLRLKEVQILLLLKEDWRLEEDLNAVIYQEKQLAEAQVPRVTATEAFNRANGLIAEIDNILAARQARALLERDPALDLDFFGYDADVRDLIADLVRSKAQHNRARLTAIS